MWESLGWTYSRIKTKSERKGEQILTSAWCVYCKQFFQSIDHRCKEQMEAMEKEKKEKENVS